MPASERAPPLVNERVIPAFAGMTVKGASFLLPTFYKNISLSCCITFCCAAFWRSSMRWRRLLMMAR